MIQQHPEHPDSVYIYMTKRLFLFCPQVDKEKAHGAKGTLYSYESAKRYVTLVKRIGFGFGVWLHRVPPPLPSSHEVKSEESTRSYIRKNPLSSVINHLCLLDYRREKHKQKQRQRQRQRMTPSLFIYESLEMINLSPPPRHHPTQSFSI